MRIKCFECGKPAKCNHHVIPKCLGGKKTVPLCLQCHGLVHDRNFMRHKELQKKGIAAAKEDGRYMGRKKGTLKLKRGPHRAKQLHDRGHTLREIARALDVTHTTVARYLKIDKDNK